LEALLASTGLVALAEIGDKTQLLSLALAAKYRRPVPILGGIALATLMNHALAGALGAWLTGALGADMMQAVLAISFLAMAAWMLIPDKLQLAERPARFGVLATTTIAFFLVEMGDKTQVATVALAAQYAAFLAVVAGTTLGMLVANAPVVVFGERLLRRVPVRLVQRAAACLFALIGLFSAATLAFGEEEIRVVETRTLPVGQANAPHRLELALYVFRGGRWRAEQVAEAVREAGTLLRQCGVAPVRAELRVVQAPRRFRIYFTQVSRELLARLTAPKPAVFFVDDTRNEPAFEAEAVGRGNSAGRPELAGTVWVAYGARDLGTVLAHELVHLLSDSGSHSDAPGNLMRPQTAPGNTRLTEAQCARLRAQGEASGLLRVN
jgi:putative Ca2+/H+ antiporter (TMEM165/GDT1 family)